MPVVLKPLYSKNIYIMIPNSSKITVMKQQQSNFMTGVSTPWGAVLEARSFRKEQLILIYLCSTTVLKQHLLGDRSVVLCLVRCLSCCQVNLLPRAPKNRVPGWPPLSAQSLHSKEGLCSLDKMGRGVTAERLRGGPNSTSVSSWTTDQILHTAAAQLLEVPLAATCQAPDVQGIPEYL